MTLNYLISLSLSSTFKCHTVGELGMNKLSRPKTIEDMSPSVWFVRLTCLFQELKVTSHIFFVSRGGVVHPRIDRSNTHIAVLSQRPMRTKRIHGPFESVN